MTCPRCGGTLVPGAVDDERSCLACGHIVYLLPLADPKELEAIEPGRKQRRGPSYRSLKL